MLGLFGSERGRVRKLRQAFDGLRHDVIFRMNPYEQYSFGTVFEHIPAELMHTFSSIRTEDYPAWRSFAKQLKSMASQGYWEHRRLGGIAGEGGMAGAEGLRLLSIEAETRAYSISEARMLLQDIQAFRNGVTEFVTSDDYNSQPLPR